MRGKEHEYWKEYRDISASAVRAGTVMGDVSCEKLECEKVEGNVKLRTVEKVVFGEETDKE